MMQVVKQTHEECMKMYMRCTKKELAEMLANRNMLDDAQRFSFQENQGTHYWRWGYSPLNGGPG